MGYAKSEHRTPAAKRCGRARPGTALPEVLVATFILAFIAMTVSALLLSSNMMTKDSTAKYALSQEAIKLRAVLKNYVTADTTVTLNAPGSPPWHLPEDDSCSDCWALQEGTHEVTSSLPAYLRTNYAATLKYKVTLAKSGSRDIRKVSITAGWTPPPQ
jgi:hypothetical protein